jgi:hypothetical protein
MLILRTAPLDSVPGTTPSYPAPSQVRERLLALPFPEYAACVARLLTALGYRNVRTMGALHAKGRNAFGGMDLTADQGQGLTASKVIVQVKQYQGPVPRAFVDELRGTMLRVGAHQGLLVTTSEFARAAAEAAQSGQHAAPVRLVEGRELVRLLSSYKVDLEGHAWSAFLPSEVEEPRTGTDGSHGGLGIRRRVRIHPAKPLAVKKTEPAPRA